MVKLLLPLSQIFVVALVVDCGKGDLGPLPPGFDAMGDWTYTQQLSDSSTLVACDDHGLLTLTVGGSAISGRAHVVLKCSGSIDLPFGDSTTGPIVGGTLSGSDIAFQANECSYSGTLFSVSGQVRAQGTVSCDAHAGAAMLHLRGAWHAVDVIDVTPPLVGGALGLPLGDTAAVPGDTLRLHLTASDNRRLAFVGYVVGSPALRLDSIAVSGTSADTVLTTVLPPLDTGIVSITFFARDSAGFRTVSGAHLTVLDMIRRPTQALTIPAPVLGLAVDPKRHVAYLAYAGTPQIGVVDLTNGGFDTAITTPFRARGLDLSVSGDSLVAAVDSAPSLGIVNLAAVPHTATVVPVDSVYSISGPRWVANDVRVMANGKAIVLLAYSTPYSCCSAPVVDYDLATGVSTYRTGANDRESLGRSWDRSRMVTATGDQTPVQARTYDAVTDSFAPYQNVAVSFGFPASSDSGGSRFLIGTGLFDGALQQLRTINSLYTATVLSPDGTIAYVEIPEGYLKVRAADGVVLERVRLPSLAYRIAITADGSTLIVVGGTPTFFQPPNNQVLVVKLQ